MKIYLAGKIPKGDEIGVTPDWRKEFALKIQVREALEFVTPESEDLDESDPVEIFGHDCYQIKNSDLVIVNASTKLGVGTSQEILIARYFRKPVVAILPHETPHRRTNFRVGGCLVEDWKHPFIAAPCDLIFESIDQLSKNFHEVIHLLSMEVTGIELIDQSIEHFISRANH